MSGTQNGAMLFVESQSPSSVARHEFVMFQSMVVCTPMVSCVVPNADDDDNKNGNTATTNGQQADANEAFRPAAAVVVVWMLLLTICGIVGHHGGGRGPSNGTIRCVWHNKRSCRLILKRGCNRKVGIRCIRHRLGVGQWNFGIRRIVSELGVFCWRASVVVVIAHH